MSEEIRWRGSVVVRRTAPFHEAFGPRRITAERRGDHLLLRPVDGGEMRATPEPDATEGRLRGVIGGSTYEVLLPAKAVEALGLGPYRAPRTDASGVPEGWERRSSDGPTLDDLLEARKNVPGIYALIPVALLVAVLIALANCRR